MSRDLYVDPQFLGFDGWILLGGDVSMRRLGGTSVHQTASIVERAPHLRIAGAAREE